jgi:protein O-GlcNAc transferase
LPERTRKPESAQVLLKDNRSLEQITSFRWTYMDKHPQNGLAVVNAALIAVITLSIGAFSQEPSAALKKADSAYRAGQAALAQKDLSAAQADFEQVVQLAPQAEQGHSALGAVLVSRGHTGEGIRELERALAIKATDSTAQMNLAMAYEQIGSPEKSLPLFSRLEAGEHLQKRTLPSYVLAAYARALAETQKPGPAITKMKAALATDSQNPELHDELGSLYAQQKNWPDAQQEFAEAIRLSPNSAVAHLHLGLVMRAEGQANGLTELAQASQLAPQNAAIAMELGRALAAGGQDDQAIPVFQHVLEIEPQSTAASYQLALALQRSNKVQEAISLLKKVVAAEPNNAEAMTNLGMALSQAQQAKDAVPILQRSIALAPDSATAHQDLAAAYVQLSQFGDAVDELRAALKLAPDLPQLHYNLGLALKMQDDAAAAIPELETAEKLDPSAPEAPYLLGVLYMQTGRYDDAAREMNTSLKLRPDNGDGWATLGSVYDKLNKLPEATSALREAIRQLPRQPDPHLTLAGVLVKQNQPAEAASERKQAADLMRSNMNRQRAEVATNAGNSQLRSGDVDGAIVQFRDALSFDASYAEAHLGLANALDRQGKPADAAAERQKADAAKTPANP